MELQRLSLGRGGFVASLVMAMLLVGTPTEAQRDVKQRGRKASVVITYQRLQETLHDVYAKPILFVVRSDREWRRYQRTLRQEAGLQVLPSPQPPDSVNGKKEAVLLVGMTGEGAALPVHVSTLSRQGSQLKADVTIDWDQQLGFIGYSPTDMVKFRKWYRLKGSCVIGLEKVRQALENMRMTAHVARADARDSTHLGERHADSRLEEESARARPGR